MRKWVVEVTMYGDYVHIENSIDVIVSSLDTASLDRTEIVIRNEGECDDA